tara:strand:- start:2340 stop:3101 length:762 start_codon:yes stop_codon:yes gene_type:complete
MNSCIYNGDVTHTRFKPVKHFLKYNTFSFLIDLDELEKLSKNNLMFSYNRFNIFSFYDKDHGERNGKSLKQWVIDKLKIFKINSNINKIRLLCYPRIFGYVFNPLSIFYCYEKNTLKAVFYEVKNTFNEQHTYIFKANENGKIEQSCKKKFYVSPFMDMNTFYDFKLLNPEEKLFVSIRQTDQKGIILTAVQTGKRKVFNFKQLLINFFKYPLMTFKIIAAIHFEAFLLWKKGAIYRSRNQKIKNNLSFEESS